MKIIASIEKSTNGKFVICTPNIESDLKGQGDSVVLAKEDFLRSYQEILDYYNETGNPFPANLKNITFAYKYDLPSFFNDFDFINVSQLAKRIGINPSLMRQYKSNSTYISQKQKKKIEEQLHVYAKELLEVTL